MACSARKAGVSQPLARIRAGVRVGWGGGGVDGGLGLLLPSLLLSTLPHVPAVGILGWGEEG